MTELSPRAREVIDTARAQTGLPLARRAALKVSVMKAVSPASVASTVTSSAWAAKVLVFTALSAVVGVSVRSWHRPLPVAPRAPVQQIAPPAPRERTIAQPASPQRGEPSIVAPVAPPLPPPAPKPSARMARLVVAVTTPPTPLPSPSVDDVSADVVALERAVAALAAGRPLDALSTARSTLASNPHGALRPEFIAVEVEALCDLNRLEEALEVEVAMEPEDRSPLVLERLRRSCLKIAR